MLQIIFGDDEHTAADGPYARVMKTRKWLYLAAVASLAVSGGLYNERAASDALKIISLPKALLSTVLMVGVGYMLLQYAFLLIQLAASYDIVLNDRFIFRRSDELASARDRVNEARQQLQSSLNTFRSDYKVAQDLRRKELEENLSAADRALSLSRNERVAGERDKVAIDQLKTLRHIENRQKAIRARAVRSLKLLDHNPLQELSPSYDPNVKLAENALLQADEAYQILHRQVPSERQGYKSAEKAVDILRVAPPALLAASAIWHYFHLWPFTN